MKGCYFWRAPRSAWQRRKLEEENSIDLDLVINGQTLVIRQETSVSAKTFITAFRCMSTGKRKTSGRSRKPSLRSKDRHSEARGDDKVKPGPR
jgi:hypothetical protein